MKRIAFIFILPALLSCELVKKKDEKDPVEETGKPIARVENKYLYYEDIEGLPGKFYSKEDSASIVQQYINNWVLKELMLMKAEAQVEENNQDLQRRIADCRNTLLIHEFEIQYLNKKLDTVVTEKDIKSYYDSSIAFFELKQNIIKGIYIKLPKDAPELDKVKTLINSTKEKDAKELKSYCLRFASHFLLEDTIWVNFDDLIKNSPFSLIEDKAEFLEKTPYSETSDNNYIYFLKIKYYKVSKQISPLEYVKDKIRNNILNQRRAKLISQLKVNIYKEAKTNNEFEIYKTK